jgi:hypothetical protein
VAGKWLTKYRSENGFLVKKDFVRSKGKWKKSEAEKDVNLNQTQLKMLGLSGWWKIRYKSHLNCGSPLCKCYSREYISVHEDE